MYSHLWKVYKSHAEPMPTNDVVLDEANPLAPVPDSVKSMLASFRAAQGSLLQDPVPAHSKEGSFMIEPTEDCPVHWLPPGSRRDAWWLYLATCKA